MEIKYIFLKKYKIWSEHGIYFKLGYFIKIKKIAFFEKKKLKRKKSKSENKVLIVFQIPIQLQVVVGIFMDKHWFSKKSKFFFGKK